MSCLLGLRTTAGETEAQLAPPPPTAQIFLPQFRDRPLTSVSPQESSGVIAQAQPPLETSPPLDPKNHPLAPLLQVGSPKAGLDHSPQGPGPSSRPGAWAQAERLRNSPAAR